MHDAVMVEDANERELVKYARFCEKKVEHGAHGSMDMGFYGRELVEKKLFRRLGYDSENDFLNRKGYAASTWFKMVGIAKGLQRLPVEEFVRLKVSNAKELCRLPEEMRYQPEWLAKAESMPAEEFAKEVEAARAAAMGMAAEDIPVMLRLPMVAGQRDAVVDGLREIAMELGLGDKPAALARALEFAVAEMRGRVRAEEG